MSLRNFITVVLTCVVVSFAAWDGSTTLEPSTTSIEGRRFYGEQEKRNGTKKREERRAVAGRRVDSRGAA